MSTTADSQTTNGQYFSQSANFEDKDFEQNANHEFQNGEEQPHVVDPLNSALQEEPPILEISPIASQGSLS